MVMIRTREEALDAANRFLSARRGGRLEIVDRINGLSYGSPEIDPGKCWIVYVNPENFMIDGKSLYVVINRETGDMAEVETV